jgi:aminoglycoside phosphotransferase (APT) family kinase protein
MAICLGESEGLLPVDGLGALWAEFRKLPPAATEVTTHGDLIPGNLLVEGSRLVGVLDGGGFAPADPSLDLVAAWHILNDERRALLRNEWGVRTLSGGVGPRGLFSRRWAWFSTTRTRILS